MNRQQNMVAAILLALIFLILWLTFRPTPTGTGLMYENHWEDGIEKPATITFEADCHSQQTSGYESFQLSDNYHRNGSHSIRNELHGTWKNDQCPYGSDNTFEAKSRQELIHGKGIHGLLYEPGDKVSQGDERWIGGSFYYPSDEGTFDSWWADTSNCVAIMQLFGSGNSGTPEIFMQLCGQGKVKIENRVSTHPSEEEIVMYTASGTFEPDRWNDIVIHWLRDWDSDGILEIWIDGLKVMSRINTPVSIRDKPDGSVKSGMYFGEELRDEIYVQYQDAWRIGDEASSYKEVDPAQQPRPETPPDGPSLVAVNDGYPLGPYQSRVPLVAEHATAIVGCMLDGAAEEWTVNWQYKSNTDGHFATGALPDLPTPHTLKCFYEPYVALLPLEPLQWQVYNAEVSSWTGERFGYTAGLTASTTGQGAMQYPIPGDVLNGTAGDRVRVDVTYSASDAGPLQIEFGDLQATGHAGALQLQNPEQHASPQVLNRTLGEGVYRAALFFTEEEEAAQGYALQIGRLQSTGCQSVTVHEVVVRKNWTTNTVEVPVVLSERP